MNPQIYMKPMKIIPLNNLNGMHIYIYIYIYIGRDLRVQSPIYIYI
jgi:hypothetical protein